MIIGAVTDVHSKSRCAGCSSLGPKLSLPRKRSSRSWIISTSDLAAGFICLLRVVFGGWTAGTLTLDGQIQREAGGYSNKAFDGLRREIEAATGWRYKDGVKLLLFNATRNRKTRAASLDFHSAIAVDLQLFRRFQASETIATLVGRIARYCDTYQNDDPTWGFSDVMGLQTTRFALWNLLVGCLPEALRSDAHNASLFVTKDLSRK